MSADGKELGRLEGYEGDNVTQYIKRLEKFLPKDVSEKEFGQPSPKVKLVIKSFAKG